MSAPFHFARASSLLPRRESGRHPIEQMASMEPVGRAKLAETESAILKFLVVRCPPKNLLI